MLAGETGDEMSETPRRLIVGITGASGIVVGVRLLELLRGAEVETHLVISKADRKSVV